MPPNIYKRLVFVEPDLLFHDILRQIFQDVPGIHDICFVESAEDVLRYASPRSIPFRSKTKKIIDLTIVVCSPSYLHFLEHYEYLRSALVYSPIILYDTHPRDGCAHMAEILHFQGYCSRLDTRDNLFRCVANVVLGIPALTPQGKGLLDIDHHHGKLCPHANLRDWELFQLNDREWSCFRYFIMGGMEAVIANHPTLEKRSLDNVMLKMKRKLGVKHNNELISLARKWGFSV